MVGGEDVDLIIETFVKKEEQNFALFNYVNELNSDVEKLQDEIKAMHEDIAKTKAEDETKDSGRSTLIKHLEVPTCDFRLDNGVFAACVNFGFLGTNLAQM